MPVDLRLGHPGSRITVTTHAEPDVLVRRAGSIIAAEPAPPFVSVERWNAYRRSSPVVLGMTFEAHWRIHSYPRRGPRVWCQRIVDGVEETHGDVDDPHLTIDIAYDDLCQFLRGSAELRDMPGSATVDGSLGALASLHWLVDQPTWLRRPSPDRDLQWRTRD
jgi:hypothetical protein